MKRQTLIRSSLAVAVLALAGCGHMHGSSSSSSSDYGSAAAMLTETYTATLTPAEEVPPAAESKGSGSFEMKLDIKTNEFSWKMSHGGLTGPATMAHIHGPGAKGANAGVVVPLVGMEGKAKLTQAQYGDLAAGLYYVNVHSAKYPGGEIRGQLMKK
ncbi:CHRD domain-containing protein [Ramlibacter sp. PS4R-6]|uniref:CHRD domain-containing protein n=1 Tax=Ramlibacter sp. PS4R-6 TaxID=3133438 RepID=UPI00309FCC2E